MANIDEAMIEKLATLCKIACSEEQKKALLADLQKIVGYVEQLDQVPTEGVEPCSYVLEALTHTPVREDVADNSLSTKDFLGNVPKHTASMVRVPNVLKS